MNAFIRLCLTVCPFIFIAGFIDSVAGGGGLISLPAYLMAGIPAFCSTFSVRCSLRSSSAISKRIARMLAWRVTWRFPEQKESM